MSERVAASVILRRKTGDADRPAASEPVTSENVDAHTVDEAVVERATTELTRLGIRVAQTGPTSISIECSKDLFERIFETQLHEHHAGDVITFTAAGTIRVPEPLRPFVEQVVLPEVPELFP